MNQDTPPGIDYAPAPRPSTWPVTFGVLAIVFGIFGLIGSLWGMFSMAMFSNMSGTLKTTVTTPPSGAGGASNTVELEKMMTSLTESYERWAVTGAVIQGILFLLAILLLTGGILLLNRMPVAAKLLTVWAYGKIVAGTGASIVGFLMQSGQMRAMREGMTRFSVTGTSAGGGPTPPIPIPGVFGDMMTLFTGVIFFFGVIWICVLPVVFLIWLNRPVVKADIATWPQPPK